MRKLAFSGAVVIAVLALVVPYEFKHSWVAFAQGPVTYAFDTYATYEFNTLKHPTGLVADTGDGYLHLFIADTGNQLIREFTTNGGSLLTLAGNGTAGYVDGSHGSAEFNSPTGITGRIGSWVGSRFCVSGCPCNLSYCWVTPTYYYTLLYVNDSSNYVVRKICSGQPPSDSSACNSSIGNTVSTVVGNHAPGYVDGPSLSAEFAPMLGLSGTTSTPSTSSPFYLADATNNVIRSWDGTNVGTFAGTGTHGLANGYRTSAQFGSPTKIAWDGSGNMYVTDADNFVVRKIDTAGNVSTFAGSGSPGFADGQGSGAGFIYPGDILFNPSDSYFYITDSGNNAIRRMDVYGNVITYAGAKDGGLVNGTLQQARFQSPTGLAISGGYLYVSDTMNNVIRRIDMNAGQVSTYIE